MLLGHDFRGHDFLSRDGRRRHGRGGAFGFGDIGSQRGIHAFFLALTASTAAAAAATTTLFAVPCEAVLLGSRHTGRNGEFICLCVRAFRGFGYHLGLLLAPLSALGTFRALLAFAAISALAAFDALRTLTAFCTFCTFAALAAFLALAAR